MSNQFASHTDTMNVRTSLQMRRVFSFLALLLVGLVLAAPALGQEVWVDFTSDFHDGNDGDANGVADWIDELNEASDRASADQFSPAERTTIENNILGSLNSIYADYNIEFVTSRPSGIHDVLYLGRDNDASGVGSSLGSAQGDIGNLNAISYSASFLANPHGNPGSLPKVTTGNFNGALEPRFDTRAEMIQELSTSLAGTAAHELGHSLGLKHHFAYSAVGITPDKYSNTGGLQNQHIIATGSTGLNESEREGGDRTLSPFSKVILDIAGGVSSELSDSGRENIALVDNPIFSDDSELDDSNDAGNTIGTAAELLFGIGESSKAAISFIEADLDGGSSDVDVFRFTTFGEATLSSHVFSEELLFAREFDPILELLDSTGSVIASSDDVNWGGDSIDVLSSVPLDNDDSSYSDDSFLFNVLLDAGTYFLSVRPTDVNVSDNPSSDDQYFLVTSLSPSFVAIPEPSSALLLSLAFGSLLRRRRLPACQG